MQAALIMALSSSMDSMDMVASKYLEQCVAMAQSMDLFGSYSEIRNRSCSRRRVYTVTAWAIYGFQGEYRLFSPADNQTDPFRGGHIRLNRLA